MLTMSEWLISIAQLYCTTCCSRLLAKYTHQLNIIQHWFLYMRCLEIVLVLIHKQFVGYKLLEVIVTICRVGDLSLLFRRIGTNIWLNKHRDKCNCQRDVFHNVYIFVLFLYTIKQMWIAWQGHFKFKKNGHYWLWFLFLPLFANDFIMYTLQVRINGVVQYYDAYN